MILLSSSLNSFIQLLGVLVIFVFVLVITYFVTKWIGGFQKAQMTGRSFQVVDTIRIAGNKYVQVLKMGDVYLVIAVGKDTVTMLAKLTEEEIGLTEEEIRSQTKTNADGGKTQMSFQETLEKLKEHFPGKQD
ncbi:MAG: flagellar biosynthetic protein FliO [Roseburia sp.]|nr:flagellar biosynthetic protein FliO [Roseburia sp.]